MLKNNFPNCPILAMTASATSKVRDDILTCLRMKNAIIFSSSFNRPNITYEVRKKGTRQAPYKDILKLIQNNFLNQSGIIYCLSRKDCEDLCSFLKKGNISCDFYHADRSPEERTNVQRAWQSGKVQLICATIAFGMGINKPDVRFVVIFFILFFFTLF